MKEPTAPSPKDRFSQDESSTKKTVNEIMSEMPTIDLFTTSQKNELFDKLMGLWYTGWKVGHDHAWLERQGDS